MEPAANTIQRAGRAAESAAPLTPAPVMCKQSRHQRGPVWAETRGHGEGRVDHVTFVDYERRPSICQRFCGAFWGKAALGACCARRGKWSCGGAYIHLTRLSLPRSRHHTRGNVRAALSAGCRRHSLLQRRTGGANVPVSGRGVLTRTRRALRGHSVELPRPPLPAFACCPARPIATSHALLPRLANRGLPAASMCRTLGRSIPNQTASLSTCRESCKCAR